MNFLEPCIVRLFSYHFSSIDGGMLFLLISVDENPGVTIHYPSVNITAYLLEGRNDNF